MNDHELLTKAQVIREYRYPEHLLDADLRSGAIPHFTTDGDPVRFPNTATRYAIPRYGVEQRIRERANARNGEAA